MKKLLLLPFLLYALTANCIHDEYSANVQKHFYDDLSQKRLLQTPSTGPIRIFMDYENVAAGGATQQNLIKRVMNISANHLYLTLTVQRQSTLYFPNDLNPQCNALSIPPTYINDGVTGDLGIMVGNEPSSVTDYIAKSTPCAFLVSNNRPIWGMVFWNNENLKYDQNGIQQLIFIAIHQLSHILAFSAVLYELYPTGNPLVSTTDGDFLNSPSIQRQMNKHYGCSSSPGMRLEDQDGTLISSHWEKHHVGNEFMIAANRKNLHVSSLTLALFETTGWYPEVNYSMSEPSQWGKDRGCAFLDIDNCQFDEFCGDSSFDCDWDGTAIGRCRQDLLTGTCSLIKYYSNTICTDELFQLKNVNAHLKAFERGGFQSKCFRSDFREVGLTANFLNNRCYLSVCSFTGKYIYLLVGQFILVCRFPNEVLNAIPGLQGTLTCPPIFDNYCFNKKTCAFGCNKNGACVNGQCLCHNSLSYSTTCLDVALATNQNSMNTGGRLLQVLKPMIRESESEDCLTGSVLNMETGECEMCSKMWGCQNCTRGGCVE